MSPRIDGSNRSFKTVGAMQAIYASPIPLTDLIDRNIKKFFGYITIFVLKIVRFLCYNNFLTGNAKCRCKVACGPDKY